MRVLRSTLCDDKIKPRHSIPQAPVQARTFGKTKRRSPKNQVRFPDEVNSFCIKLLKQDPGKRIPALPVVSKHVQKPFSTGAADLCIVMEERGIKPARIKKDRIRPGTCDLIGSNHKVQRVGK